ncbi:MAG: putative nucleotidyltransferase substrate binding domain-containing protein [Thauera sp.]|jgi:CBS domain-containing protein|nr:putative nucleotidyltransferase substrate binding domain-containing protein [Thauera sp.]
MAEENQFFRPIREFCQRKVVSCAEGDALVDIVARMREHGISCVVVLEAGHPKGILTDRDLRNKVVATGTSPSSLTVGDVMTSPVVTVSEHDVLYEALYRISRHNIHRLVVTDQAGALAGIITVTDILRLQAHSPHQLVVDIEKADSVDTLRDLHRRVQRLIVHLSGTGIAIRDMVKLIANLNDQILIRLIELLRREKYPGLTNDFAFVVMGSEGRGEQTLSTDQDNAIIHADSVEGGALQQLEAFSIDLIDALISIGIPACPGGIMAKNPPWRRSASAWKMELTRWLSTPSPENVMTGSMFMDLRPLYGRRELADALRDHALHYMSQEPVFLVRMVQNMTRFAPPLGWFGRILTEKSGPYRGMVDVKKAGIFAITDGIKALAMESRCLDGSTHDRMEALVEKGVLMADQMADLRAAFDFLVLKRLQGQVAALRAGAAPNNYVALDQLNAMEQGELRLALQGVGHFQRFMHHHFKLHLMRN